VTGHYYYTPADKSQVLLPRSFTFMGQKFTVDSWVTTNVTFDRVLGENGIPVPRRIPSVLDIAYTVFKNDHTILELVRMMKDPEGEKFRDGIPYHPNLVALRKCIDAIPEELWDSSIYFMWLKTLRSLSIPSDTITSSAEAFQDGKTAPSSLLPQVALTAAWQDRVLNTQCASWTQLRHDTILYVKQSYCGGGECEYPSGYVDPNVAFWRQFFHMAESTTQIIQNLTIPYIEKKIPIKGNRYYTTNNSYLKGNIVSFYQTFAEVVEKLATICEKQANNQPLTSDGGKKRYSGRIKDQPEVEFLKDTIEVFYGSGDPMYTGWYSSLFYKGGDDSSKWDPLVADVHTDGSDPQAGDPGCVLHEAVGNVYTMLVAIDRGESVTCYAGPVYSHYEFTCPLNERLTDEEWKAVLVKKAPPHPRWTQSFLVPGKAADNLQFEFGEDF